MPKPSKGNAAWNSNSFISINRKVQSNSLGMEQMWFAELASSVTRGAWNSVVLSAILICGCRSTAIPPPSPTAFVLYTFVYFVPTTSRYVVSLLRTAVRCIVIDCSALRLHAETIEGARERKRRNSAIPILTQCSDQTVLPLSPPPRNR